MNSTGVTPLSPKRFNLNRAQVVDENFVAFVRGCEGGESTPTEIGGSTARTPGDVIDQAGGLTGQDLIELLESQFIARHQDIEARNMRARNEGFYTIGSAGHEGNAVVGRLTRHTDPAFVHYRSGAFMAERARTGAKAGVGDGVNGFIRDTMLSFAASRNDATAGGRHKVWGSKKLWVPPQTSTIASHLAKAVGAALSLSRARKLRINNGLPGDAIVVCTFGDASVSHAVAQTAFNAAARAAHQHLPVPILFVCEDNGIGISVETPPGWLEAAYSARYGLHYFHGNGLDLRSAYAAMREAVAYCRQHRAPVFLHLKTVRLLGHAGSDVETEYHTWEQIEAAEAKDPLLASARLVIELGLLDADAVLSLYEDVRERVRAAAASAAQTPKLSSAEEIMVPLAPYSPDKVAAETARTPDANERIRIFGGEDRLPESGPPRHMAVLINNGLTDLLIKYPEAIIFGEDVAKKGGVYHVTTGLTAKFGVGRAFNTVLDETTILGLGLGAAHLGLLPIPEIQYLAYYHNAEDQIRGEACSLQFFSNDQFRNPMVMRIAGWGYQKGFGGHFHNDNSIAALRDVPGLIIATPSRGDDAVKMMRTCMALARVDGRVVAFIEPIALYMTKDLHEPKDQGWSFAYPPPAETIPFGKGAVYEDCNEATKPQSDGGKQNRDRKGAETSGGATKPRSDEEAAARRERSMARRRDVAAESTTRLPNYKIAQSHNNPITSSSDLTILTFSNGVYMSLRAAKTLRERHGIRARVVDLRWLNPLNESFIIEQSLATRRVLVVDEGRRTGGISESILALLHESCGGEVKAARLNSLDTYIPLGPAADHVLPQEADVVDRCRRLLDPKLK